MKLDSYIADACIEAEKSPMCHKYGAILIFRSKIVSRGHNSYHQSYLLQENMET